MHYFIVGAPRSGKSAAAGLALEILGTRPGGFRLAADDFQPDGSRDIYMLDCRNPADFCGDHNLMYHRSASGAEEMEDGVFDLVGVPLLRRRGNAPLILMDELSEIHAEESAFQRAVLDTLDGKIPVLAVLRDTPDRFLMRLRTRPDVVVFHLTKQNQNLLPFQLASQLKSALNFRSARPTAAPCGGARDPVRPTRPACNLPR